MNLDKMSFNQPPATPEPTPEAVAPKKEQSVVEKWVNRGKTGLVMLTALTALGGNMKEAEGAERPKPVDPYAERGAVNDATRNERFQEFNKLYTEGLRGFDRVKSKKDA